MQVPRRKPGTYTNQKTDAHLTPDKFAALERDLARMKKQQPELAAEVKRLASDGDFSENVPYQMAKGRLRGLNQRILETEDLLKRSTIIRPDRDTDTVRIGHTVTVECGGERRVYTILGSSETDPGRGVISHVSPIGAALLGKQAGEVARVTVKDKIREYRIVKIE